MHLFFKLFDPGISMSLFAIVLVLAGVASIITYSKGKSILPIWLLACLFCMVYLTVIGREPRAESSIHLMPFWSIQAIREGYIETIYEKLYNIIFFMPYGILLGLRFGSLPSGKLRAAAVIKAALLIGFLTSVVIELLQLITRTGTCETDDMICNTFGCGIGAMIGMGISIVLERHKQRRSSHEVMTKS